MSENNPKLPSFEEVYHASLRADTVYMGLIRKWHEYANVQHFPYFPSGPRRYAHIERSRFAADHGFLDIELNPNAHLLDNTVHELFKHEKFDYPAAQVYEVLLPALRLATKLLGTDEAYSWLYHVLKGRVVSLQGVDIETDKPISKLVLQTDPGDVDLTQARVEVDAQWKRIAKDIKFHWSPSGHDRLGVMYRSRLAALKDLNPTLNITEEDAHNDQYFPHIGLSTMFGYQLLHPSVTAKQSIWERMRIYFLLAKVIVHELAHAFYASRGLPGEEPYAYGSDGMRELGFSLDAKLFGCLIFPGSWDTRPIGPLIARTWRHAYKFPAIWVPVATSWIYAMFRKDTWYHIERRIERLPKHPCTSDAQWPQYIFASRYMNLSWYTAIYIDGKEAGGPGASQPNKNLSADDWFKEIAFAEMEQWSAEKASEVGAPGDLEAFIDGC